MSATPKMPLWAKIASAALIVATGCYVFYIYRVVYTAITSDRSTYTQTCAPLQFIHRVDYYNGTTFVVCGSPTTQPVLKEYVKQ